MNRKQAARAIRQSFDLDLGRWKIIADRSQGRCRIYVRARRLHSQGQPERTVFAMAETWRGAITQALQGAAMLARAGVEAR